MKAKLMVLVIRKSAGTLDFICSLLVWGSCDESCIFTSVILGKMNGLSSWKFLGGIKPMCEIQKTVHGIQYLIPVMHWSGLNKRNKNCYHFINKYITSWDKYSVTIYLTCRFLWFLYTCWISDNSDGYFSFLK